MIKKFVSTFAIFIGVDLIWLGVLAQPIYDKYIGDFLRDDPKWSAALLFYALFVSGLIYFAVDPALKDNSQKLALKNGALFGFFTYMTYELTNYAVVADWPWQIVPIDIVWGTVLGATVSVLSYKYLNKQA